MTRASLHVVTSDLRRGAETFALDLVTTLEQAGHDVRVVALSGSGTSEVYSIPTLGESRRSPGMLRRLRAEVSNVDVVVAHGSATLEACALGLAGTGVPFIYRTIGDPAYWVPSAWRRHGVGWMLRRASRNVALWPTAAEELASVHGVPSERIDVIPNAVRAERFSVPDSGDRKRAREHLGVAGERPCLAFVGSLSPEKDVASLLRALGQLRDEVLLVAGDGPEGPQLRTLGEQLAPGRVRFLGAVKDPRKVYAAADLLVLPSLSEGMPAVIIEAGLMETPTVASAVGAIPEMISDAETGFLVPPCHPESLARKLLEALPDAAQVGRRARVAFDGWLTMEAVTPAWAASIDAAASRHR